MRLDPADYAEGPLPMLHRPSSWPSSPPTRWPRPCCGGPAGAWTDCDRKPDGGRTQCAASRQAAAQCRRRAGLWRARPGQHCRNCARWAFPSGWRADMATPKKVREALDQGAAGVQVGTAFAFSRESGCVPDLKKTLLAQAVDRAPARCLPIRWPRLPGFPVQGGAAEGTSSRSLSIRSASGSAIWAICGSRTPPRRARLATAARPSRWRTTWPRAARSKIRWAASACAMP
jgi:hypothetical protein